MSDVIQITADTGELEFFLKEYADYPFPALGMICPVKGCSGATGERGTLNTDCYLSVIYVEL